MSRIGLTIAASSLLVFGCGDCEDSTKTNNGKNNGADVGQNNGGNNGADGGGNNGTDGGGDNVLSLTLPLQTAQFGPFNLTAGSPIRIPLSFTLPADAEFGELVGLSVDLEATAEAMTIVRTDGGVSPDPTLSFRLGAAAGDDPNAACAADPAIDVTITGNSDFSQKTASDSGTGASGLLAADDGSNVFSACVEVESSVDIELTPAAVFDLEIDAACDDPPEDVAGQWAGSYLCTDTCNPDQMPGEVGLTILQAGETAIYFDDGGAFYFGSVCGPTFSFVGGHTTYSEWGRFTRTGADSATKESTWKSSLGDECGGDCSDDLTLQ